MILLCITFHVAAKTGALQLDRVIVTREVGFYALAIFLLYIALQDTEPADDDELGPNHIFISFWEACMLFSGYIAYVIVCANMDAIVALATRSRTRLGLDSYASYGTMRSTHKMVGYFRV
jgi:hypothetical protein